MFSGLTLNTNSGESYALRLRGQHKPSKSLSPTLYNDIASARSFIRRFSGASSNWQKLCRNNMHYERWRNSTPSAPIEEFIAKQLVRGQILFFKIEKSQPDLTNGVVLKATKSGKQYKIVPQTALLFEKANPIIRFMRVEDAVAFLTEINVEKINLEEAAKKLGKAVHSRDEYLSALAQALVAEEFVVLPYIPYVPPVGKTTSSAPLKENDRPIQSVQDSNTEQKATSTEIPPKVLKQVNTLIAAAEKGSAFCQVCENNSN